MDNLLYLHGNQEPYLNSRTTYAEIQVQLEWVKKGTIEDDHDSASDLREEDQMMKRQCHEYLSKLSTVFGYEDQKWYSVTLHHSYQNQTGNDHRGPGLGNHQTPRFCNVWSPDTDRRPRSHPTKTRATAPCTSETAEITGSRAVTLTTFRNGCLNTKKKRRKH